MLFDYKDIMKMLCMNSPFCVKVMINVPDSDTQICLNHEYKLFEKMVTATNEDDFKVTVEDSNANFRYFVLTPVTATAVTICAQHLIEKTLQEDTTLSDIAKELKDIASSYNYQYSQGGLNLLI